MFIAFLFLSLTDVRKHGSKSSSNPSRRFRCGQCNPGWSRLRHAFRFDKIVLISSTEDGRKWEDMSKKINKIVVVLSADQNLR